MRPRLFVSALALAGALLAPAARAEGDGPAAPTPPWFVVANMPSRDPKIGDTRWLWNREARSLRYCRQDAASGEFSCAADVVMPEGRWVLQRIQARPSDDVAGSARFYSPDLDRTLTCQAMESGAFGCD
jgi:hypothetical protein